MSSIASAPGNSGLSARRYGNCRRQPLGGERREIARRILYLNINVAPRGRPSPGKRVRVIFKAPAVNDLLLSSRLRT
jgi:hypothetical protein